MKKRSVLVLTLALWALAGCGAAPGADESAGGEMPPVLAEAAAPKGEDGLSAALLEREARPLTEEEILAAYDRAEEAYGWFYLATLPCGSEERIVDGWIYRRVDYPGMENLADLRAYLRGLFSEELVASLLETGGTHPLYRDVEGDLYALPTSRERDESVREMTAEVEPYGEAGYSVQVSVETSAQGALVVENHSFPYEFVEDRWVFTDFWLVD